MASPLSPEEEELIERLTIYQEEFESPSVADLQTLGVSMAPDAEDGHQLYKLMTGVTILTVQLLVEFSKYLPGFDTLKREDQITLLKACSSQVMMLRTSRKYDINTDSIVYANGRPYTRQNYYTAGVGETADPLFDFCKKMVHMKVDNAEYAVLTAIAIFSVGPPLSEPKRVEKLRECYMDTLRKYVEIHRPKDHAMFQRLLLVLAEMRTLGILNSQIWFILKVKNNTLPSFLSEILDVGD